MSLVIDSLSKTYSNGVRALVNVSIEINIGMFGLLGPNGAGKSTLMRILATLQTPDAGSVYFHALDVLADPYALRRILGYLPQSFGVYPKQSARSLLHYLAALKGISSKKQQSMIVDEVVEKTNLAEVQHHNVSDYSGGMKQRFGIAQLLLNRPKLIVVDEPTAGLDPAERRRFLNVLRQVGIEHTVIFSTHIVEDVRELCHDMAMINHGKILQHASPRSAIAQIEGKIWRTTGHPDQLKTSDRDLRVISSQFGEDNQQIVRVFSQNKPGPRFHAAEPTLEDVYFVEQMRSE